MLSFIEAQHIIKSFAQSYGTEKILLDDALGRVIGEDIYADRDYPPFNRSAMDGYAIQKEDFEKRDQLIQNSRDCLCRWQDGENYQSR